MSRRRPLPRDFHLLLASQGISLVGGDMQQIALPLWVFQQTGSTIDTGIAFALQFIPIVLLAPWVGYLADRFDRRRLMITCELLAALVVAGLLIGVRANILALVLGLAALTRIFNAVTMPAMQAIIVSVVPEPDRDRSASLSTVVFAAVQMTAPLAGTALSATFGFEVVLLINLGSFLVSSVLLLPLAPCPGKPGLRQAARSTWYALRDHASRLLRWVVAAESAYFLLWGADAALALLILQAEFGAAEAGAYATAAGVGWVVASALVASRFSGAPLRLLAAGALASPVAAIGFVTLLPFGPLAALVPAVLIGVGNVTIVVGATTVFQQEATPETAGRLFVVRRAVLNAMLSLSYLLLPGVSQAGLGHRATLVVFSILTGAAVLVLVRAAVLASRPRIVAPEPIPAEV